MGREKRDAAGRFVRRASDIFFNFARCARARLLRQAINFSIPYGLSFLLICPVAPVPRSRNIAIRKRGRDGEGSTGKYVRSTDEYSRNGKNCRIRETVSCHVFDYGDRSRADSELHSVSQRRCPAPRLRRHCRLRQTTARED